MSASNGWASRPTSPSRSSWPTVARWTGPARWSPSRRRQTLGSPDREPRPAAERRPRRRPRQGRGPVVGPDRRPVLRRARLHRAVPRSAGRDGCRRSRRTHGRPAGLSLAEQRHRHRQRRLVEGPAPPGSTEARSLVRPARVYLGAFGAGWLRQVRWLGPRPARERGLGAEPPDPARRRRRVVGPVRSRSATGPGRRSGPWPASTSSTAEARPPSCACTPTACCRARPSPPCWYRPRHWRWRPASRAPCTPSAGSPSSVTPPPSPGRPRNPQPMADRLASAAAAGIMHWSWAAGAWYGAVQPFAGGAAAPSVHQTT